MKLTMLLLIMFLMVLLLNGCGAIYQYKRAAESCQLSIYSFREVGKGEVIVEDCNINSGASELTSNTDALQAIIKIVSKLP